MKNIAILFFLSLAIVSCQKEPVLNKLNEIKIVGQYASDESLKTVFINPTVNWVAGTDHIGVFSDLAITAPGAVAVNVDYAAQQTGTTSTFTSTTPVYFNGSSTPHSFSAIYPYKSGSTFPSQAWTAVPISLPAVQTQSASDPKAHIGPLDVMIAKTILTPAAPGETNPTLTFTFNHVFTILKFNVTCATAHTLTQIVANDGEPRIMSIDEGNTINIGQDNPADGVPYFLNNPTGGTPIITLNTSLAISSTAASAYMLIFPQDFKGTFTFTFKNENGTIYTLTKAGQTLGRGKIYDINVAIPNGGGANAWE